MASRSKITQLPAVVRAWLDANRATGISGVVSCSALKRRYREFLVGGASDEVQEPEPGGGRSLGK